jgi:RNA polymerase sigma-70 factor (ECF subfamily)
MAKSHPPDWPAADSTSQGLLARVQSHDAAAWQRLVDLYGPLVAYWCRRHGLGDEDVADVFQEIFRAVALHIADFRKDRPGDSFRGWLLTITRNKIRDWFRRRQRQVAAAGGPDAQRQLLQVPDPGDGPEDANAPDQQQALLRRALAQLEGEFEPPTWQAFWRVTALEQAPAEVAAALGLSLNAVYKAKARVLGRLRRELGDLLE